MARATEEPAVCPIVALGASAGALQPMRQFFGAIPANGGVAYVVIQHLNPEHESLLASILDRECDIDVAQPEDGTPVEADRVYVIPPGAVMTIGDGRLRLSRPEEPRGRRLPVDTFLRSLAAAQGEWASAIILSGSGSDGTEGVKAIKAAGGLVLVQDPETADHASMPRSALATGIVDMTLAVEDMPRMLRALTDHDQVDRRSEPNEDDRRLLDDILRLLRSQTGHDFRCYKESTLLRRLSRRVGLLHLPGLAEYLERLRGDDSEGQRLCSDLLINVTSFFRDPGAWEVLQQQALTDIVERHWEGTAIRAWVAGCATGEEAYSLAMALAEEVQRQGKRCKIQLYASDIDLDARERAREGVYPSNISQDVPPALLARYFVEEGGYYRVSHALREMVIFANQNLLEDPPFSNVDLLSCRNVLIYMKSEMQRRAFEMFHFALNQDGFLFLGSSESMARHGDLFHCIDKKHRLYQRRGEKRRQRPVEQGEHRAFRPPMGQAVRSIRHQPDDAQVINRMLLKHCTPPALLLGHDDRLLATHGNTDPYLRVPTGRPTDDVFAMVRDDVRTKLRMVLRTARKEHRPARGYLRRESQGSKKDRATEIVIEAQPDPAEEGNEDHLLVTFSDRTVPALVHQGQGDDSNQALVALERELEQTRADLTYTVQELQESNERHKIQNEEIMSMNEELQSANEELETSKEELQSLNEELSTLNHQLETKLEELEHTTDDLQNLLRSTNVATLFLDTTYQIRRYTPAAADLLNLRTGDIGRPMRQVASELNDSDMLSDAEEVLADLNSRQREVATDGHQYLRVIQPYRTEDNHIEGVVITFTDISELKKVQAELEEARREAVLHLERLNQLFMQAPVFIAVHEGPEHVYILSNELHDEVVGNRRLIGLQLREAMPELEGQGIFEHYDEVYQAGKPIHREEFEATFQRRGETAHGWFQQLLQPWRDSEGRIIGVMSFAFEVTEVVRGRRERERIAEELQRSYTESDAILTNIRDGLIVCRLPEERLLLNPAARELFAIDEDTIPTLADLDRVLAFDDLDGRPLPRAAWPLERAARGESYETYEVRVRQLRTDKRFYASFSGNTVDSQDGGSLAVVSARDISDRIRWEDLLAEHSEQLARRNEDLQHFASLASHDLRAPLRLVSTYLELLTIDAADQLTDEHRQHIDQAIDGVHRMRELIDGMLSYARLEGQTVESGESVSCEEAVDKALAMIDEQVRSSGAVIAVDALPRVRGQCSLLAQCLQNILINAIKYCDEVRPRIAITAEPNPCKPQHWLIRVIDNGPGIPPSEREEIFEMFRRGSTSNKRSGSGIGLGFTRRVIESFGGAIWIEDTTGKGTSVCISLPASAPEPPADAGATRG